MGCGDPRPAGVRVRAAAGELTIFAKKNNITLLIVSHVTKDGQIAGPKVLEHMVDTVLYFEGEKDLHFRILRAVKNRFGPDGLTLPSKMNMSNGQIHIYEETSVQGKETKKDMDNGESLLRKSLLNKYKEISGDSLG